MALILIGGGSRSGKSSYALAYARQRGQCLALIATAEALDDEMRERIVNHRKQHGADFTTIEEPLEIAQIIRCQEPHFDVLVVDCLTLWISNLITQTKRDLADESCRLLDAARSAHNLIIMVTNEVGCGLVPNTLLGRQFRDAAGRLNQMAAAAADEVYWMMFGIPMKVK